MQRFTSRASIAPSRSSICKVFYCFDGFLATKLLKLSLCDFLVLIVFTRSPLVEAAISYSRL